MEVASDDVQRGRLVWRRIDSRRSEDIAGALDDLKRRTDIEALVWDGARGHRGEKVRNVGLVDDHPARLQS